MKTKEPIRTGLLNLLGEIAQKNPIEQKIDAAIDQKGPIEQDIPHKASDEEIDDLLSD